MFQLTRQGAIDVIRGNDALTLENLPDAARVLQQCAANKQPRVVFDLARVPLIDSSGLELLLDTQDAYLCDGGALKLAAPNALCRDILAVTGLDHHFQIYDGADLAAGSFVH